jgi:hypothetical protein
MNISAICIVSLVGLTLCYGTTATAQQRDEVDDGLAEMVEELNSQAPIPYSEGATLVRVEKNGMTLRYFIRREDVHRELIDPTVKKRVRQNMINSACVKQRELIEKGYQFEDIVLDADDHLILAAISNRSICQRSR